MGDFTALTCAFSLTRCGFSGILPVGRVRPEFARRPSFGRRRQTSRGAAVSREIANLGATKDSEGQVGAASANPPEARGRKIRKGRGTRGHQPLKGKKPREASALVHGLTTVGRRPPSGGSKTREPGYGQRQAGRAIADEAMAISGRESFEGQEP